jgi:chromosomal replication initiator protein
VDRTISVESIQQLVATHFGIQVSDLKDKSRKKEVVMPRQIAMYLTKEHTDLALKSIGYHFGGRDHSTVIHSIQAINDALDADRTVKEAVQVLRKELKSRQNGSR